MSSRRVDGRQAKLVDGRQAKWSNCRRCNCNCCGRVGRVGGETKTCSEKQEVSLRRGTLSRFGSPAQAVVTVASLRLSLAIAVVLPQGNPTELYHLHVACNQDGWAGSNERGKEEHKRVNRGNQITELYKRPCQLPCEARKRPFPKDLK